MTYGIKKVLNFINFKEPVKVTYIVNRDDVIRACITLELEEEHWDAETFKLFLGQTAAFCAEKHFKYMVNNGADVSGVYKIGIEVFLNEESRGEFDVYSSKGKIESVGGSVSFNYNF